jgi:hypothetical protein
MNARILIIRVMEGFRVAAFNIESPVRKWTKIYRTKDTCLVALRTADLIGSSDFEEATVSDFENTGSMMVFHVELDIKALRKAGFVEEKNTVVN